MGGPGCIETRGNQRTLGMCWQVTSAVRPGTPQRHESHLAGAERVAILPQGRRYEVRAFIPQFDEDATSTVECTVALTGQELVVGHPDARTPGCGVTVTLVRRAFGTPAR